MEDKIKTHLKRLYFPQFSGIEEKEDLGDGGFRTLEKTHRRWEYEIGREEDWWSVVREAKVHPARVVRKNHLHKSSLSIIYSFSICRFLTVCRIPFLGIIRGLRVCYRRKCSI